MIALLAFGVLTQGTLSAQTQWLGGTGNWNDSAKWNNDVPNSSIAARFNVGSASQVTVNGPARANLLDVRRNQVTLQFSSGAELDVTGAIQAGANGTAGTPALLNLLGPDGDSATVSAGFFLVGVTSGAAYNGNSIAISGSGLEIEALGSRSVVGRSNDYNTLSVTGGASLTMHSLRVGGYDQAQGNRFTVSGTGSSARVESATVEVGSGTGAGGRDNQIMVTNGGIFSTNQSVTIAQLSGVKESGISITGQQSEFHITEGGILSIGSASAGNAGGNFAEIGDSAKLQTDGQIVLYGYDASNPEHGGRNRLTIDSSGTLVQTGDAGISVEAGALLQLKDGGILESEQIGVKSDGRMEAAGDGLHANVSLMNGAALAIGGDGDSPAKLTLAGEVEFFSGSVLEWDLFGDGISDQIDLLVNGSLTIGDNVSLLVNFVDFTPEAPVSWTLFDQLDGEITGDFSLYTLPDLGAGLSWDLADFNAAGGWEVRVIPEPGFGLLLGAGSAFVAFAVRRRRRQSVALGALVIGAALCQPAVHAWEVVDLGTSENIMALGFAAGCDGLAVSNSGAVYRLQEGAWKQEVSEPPFGGEAVVRGCSILKDGSVWIASAGKSGARGIASLESGSWTEVEVAGASNLGVNGFWTDQKQQLHLAAMNKGQIARWDGATWHVSNLGRPEDLTAIHGDSPQNLWAVGDRGAVFQSDDGGVTWMQVELPEALENARWEAVFALSPNRVWMVGREGKIGFWNGEDVQVQSLTQPRILRGVLALNEKEIYIVGSAVGPKAPGLLMRSSGDGAWEAVETGRSDYGTLNAIARDESGAIYIAGNEGIILKSTP